MMCAYGIVVYCYKIPFHPSLTVSVIWAYTIKMGGNQVQELKNNNVYALN